MASKEYPGLRSLKFESVDQYGIGFYSIFMIASEVYITSRQYTAALGDALTLKFPDGLSNALQWIKDISFSEYQTTVQDKLDYITSNIARLRPIIEGVRSNHHTSW